MATEIPAEAYEAAEPAIQPWVAVSDAYDAGSTVVDAVAPILIQAGREAAAKAIEADRSYDNLSGAPYTYFAQLARGNQCSCGHLASAHDAGECWTHPDNDDHPDPACPCSWYEPVGGGDRG